MKVGHSFKNINNLLRTQDVASCFMEDMLEQNLFQIEAKAEQINSSCIGRI